MMNDPSARRAGLVPWNTQELIDELKERGIEVTLKRPPIGFGLEPHPDQGYSSYPLD